MVWPARDNENAIVPFKSSTEVIPSDDAVTLYSISLIDASQSSTY